MDVRRVAPCTTTQLHLGGLGCGASGKLARGCWWSVCRLTGAEGVVLLFAFILISAGELQTEER